MRAKEEIQVQINWLKKQREEVPEFSIFKDNNWKLIDAQIFILEGKEEYISYSHADEDTESAAYEANEYLKGNIETLIEADE